MSCKVAALVGLLLACSHVVTGEVFTALVHMEGLVNAERQLLDGLNTYITQERKRLDALDRLADNVKNALDKAGNDPAQYLHHPVNVFQLLNRYYNGWMKLGDSIYQDNGRDLMANLSLHQYQFPSLEDYKGAAVAIRRLQDTYNLTTAAFARGLIGAHGPHLSSHDCYLIGREAYLEDNWEHTVKWMLEALSLFGEEKDQGQLDLTLVYDHLAFAEFKLNNVKKAIHYTNLLLQYDPSHSRARGNLNYFTNLLESEPEKYDIPQRDVEKRSSNDSEHDRYEELCRQADPLPKGLHHKLICYYDDRNRNPRLILSPVKVEVLYVDPDIYVFRDILTDAEMNRLKELAAPKLARATARNAATGQFEPVEYRISKSGWLGPADDPLGYIEHIDQHIEDVTGLEMDTAEMLQVVNYGIGGHYEPHYDFARKGEDAFSSLGSGNRISTLLIYMSDVELGGATVFPLIGARVAPSKGDAAYWLNLKRSGEGDLRTRHAACPVLVGSKWVCNKWIHERGQEFRLPCSVNPDE